MLFGLLTKLVKVFKRIGVWGKGNFLQKVSLSPYIIYYKHISKIYLNLSKIAVATRKPSTADETMPPA